MTTGRKKSYNCRHLPNSEGLVHGVDDDTPRARRQPPRAVEPVFAVDPAHVVRDDAAFLVVRDAGLDRDTLVADASENEAALNCFDLIRWLDDLWSET